MLQIRQFAKTLFENNRDKFTERVRSWNLMLTRQRSFEGKRKRERDRERAIEREKNYWYITNSVFSMSTLTIVL